MIDLTFSGRLLGTLGSAAAVVLLLVALSAATYVAMTLFTALRALPGAASDRAARLLGLTTTAGVGVLAALGLRVGPAGSGGELIPSLAVGVAGAAAAGAAAACLVGAGQRGLSLMAGPRRRRDELREDEAKARESEGRRFLSGADLADEITESTAALGRLEAALEKLGEARARLAEKIAALGDKGAGSGFGATYRKALDELGMKIELGERIRAAARICAFRLTCNEPLRRLARRRPREATLGLEQLEGGGALPGAPSLEAAAGAINAFLTEIEVAHAALSALEAKRPEGILAGSDEDPLAVALADLETLGEAYRAVLERLDVICVRRSAQATLDEVADAAGALSGRSEARRSDEGAIQELAAELAHAESAMAMATPEEGESRALAAALARSTAALGRSDGASLDELLKALKSIA
jgi:hypothetical protein